MENRCGEHAVHGGPRSARLLAATLLIAGAALPAAPLRATTIAVTTLDDELNTDGDCSLREAIRAANLDAAVDGCAGGGGDDVVSLPAGTYLLTRVGDDDAGASGDLDVTGNLVLGGAGADVTVIDGNGVVTSDRVLHLVGAPTVTVSGVTLRGGKLASGDGGGILNGSGALTVTASVIESSSAQHGGGIASYAPGVLAILDSRVSGNSASGNGGGVYGTGAMTVSGSLIASNDSGGGAGGIDISGEGSLTLDTTTLSGNSGIGGGAFWAAGTVRTSLVSGNTASFGGGIAVPFGRVLDVTNSTVSGNAVVSDGGGIYCAGTLSLSNVTVADNVADVDQSSAGNGGGIFNLLGTVILRNTIVAANADRGGEAPDCSGPLTSAGHNLIETTAGCSVGGDTTGNLTGIGAGLDLLADNGGPTRTHALLAGSPAIDAGNPAGCTDQAGFLLITDQRGLGRVAGAACDVGAFELGAVLPTTTTTTTTTSTAVPTTATTTTHPPECDADSPAACDDAEPCTVDACSAGRCVHEPAAGADAARCVCQRPEPPECAADAVPARLSRRFGRACHLLDRAAAARSHGLARRLVGRAIAKDRAARRIAGRAGERKTISAECAAAWRARLTDAEARARAFRGGL